MKTVAIIPAGGKGVRFGTPGKKKQFLEVDGCPLIVHTLRAVETSPLIDSIVLVVPKEDERWFVDTLPSYGLKKVKRVVSGGQHRQDSVWSGIRVADADADLLLVHDGVRPLVDASLIERVIKGAAEVGAAVAALPVTDTVKMGNPEQRIVLTLPRGDIYLAQTPQAFRREIIVSAYEAAMRDGFYGTDDSSLVERMGVSVLIIPGSFRNVKVTTPEDLPFLQFLMSRASYVASGNWLR